MKSNQWKQIKRKTLMDIESNENKSRKKLQKFLVENILKFRSGCGDEKFGRTFRRFMNSLEIYNDNDEIREMITTNQEQSAASLFRFFFDIFNISPIEQVIVKRYDDKVTETEKIMTYPIYIFHNYDVNKLEEPSIINLIENNKEVIEGDIGKYNKLEKTIIFPNTNYLIIELERYGINEEGMRFFDIYDIIPTKTIQHLKLTGIICYTSNLRGCQDLDYETSGHYTCFMCDQNDSWYYYDDFDDDKTLYIAGNYDEICNLKMVKNNSVLFFYNHSNSRMNLVDLSWLP